MYPGRPAAIHLFFRDQGVRTNTADGTNTESTQDSRPPGSSSTTASR
jgi:hypothetical protein